MVIFTNVENYLCNVCKYLKFSQSMEFIYWAFIKVNSSIWGILFLAVPQLLNTFIPVKMGVLYEKSTKDLSQVLIKCFQRECSFTCFLDLGVCLLYQSTQQSFYFLLMFISGLFETEIYSRTSLDGQTLQRRSTCQFQEPLKSELQKRVADFDMCSLPY